MLRTRRHYLSQSREIELESHQLGGGIVVLAGWRERNALSFRRLVAASGSLSNPIVCTLVPSDWPSAVDRLGTAGLRGFGLGDADYPTVYPKIPEHGPAQPGSRAKPDPPARPHQLGVDRPSGRRS